MAVMRINTVSVESAESTIFSEENSYKTTSPWSTSVSEGILRGNWEAIRWVGGSEVLEVWFYFEIFVILIYFLKDIHGR